MKSGMIKATSSFERLVHWALALSCITLLFSGAGMMYNSLNIIAELVGGMANLSAIHSYAGIVFAVSLVLAIVVWFKEAGMLNADDLRWFACAGGYLWKVENMPPVGKYNAGQKLFFLVIALYGIIMVISGFVMWFPLGFAVETVRMMFVLHALGFVIIFPFFIIHLYLATIGVPGTASAMFSGWVSRQWAATHHPKWLKEEEAKGSLVVSGKGK